MKLTRVILMIAVTAALLGLWLATVDLRAMGQALMRAHPAWIAVAAAGSLLHLVVRAVRWRAILGPAARAVPLMDLWRYTFIGYAVTFAIPGRAGEVVRPALLWRRGGTPFGEALGSILVERVLDVATLAGMLLAFTLIEPESSPVAMRRIAFILAVAAVGGLLALALAARFMQSAAGAFVARTTGWLPTRLRAPLRGLLVALLDSLGRIASVRAFLTISALSLLTWTPVILTLFAGLRATDIEAPVAAPLALVPLTALGIAIPTPAGVGGYHAAMTWGLTHLMGAEAGPAAAAAVVTHAASVLPILVVGLYACWREGLTLSALRRNVPPPPEVTSEPDAS